MCKALGTKIQADTGSVSYVTDLKLSKIFLYLWVRIEEKFQFKQTLQIICLKDNDASILRLFQFLIL